MPVAPRLTQSLQVWLHVQSTVWLALLVALALHGPGELPLAWRDLGLTLLALSIASLVLILGAVRNLADLTTIARGVGLTAVAWAGFSDRGMIWFLCAATVVIGDLLDGALARRYGGSAQGAILDMETDQATVLTLAVLAVIAGIGLHVLVLPALRYIFVLAMWLVGAKAHDPKPVNGDNGRGRRICAFVLASLLAALCPVVPNSVGNAVTIIAVVLLAWSFSSDALFLVSQARTRKVKA